MYICINPFIWTVWVPSCDADDGVENSSRFFVFQVKKRQEDKSAILQPLNGNLGWRMMRMFLPPFLLVPLTLSLRLPLPTPSLPLLPLQLACLQVGQQCRAARVLTIRN